MDNNKLSDYQAPECRVLIADNQNIICLSQLEIGGGVEYVDWDD